MVGLDAAGKTTILYKLKLGEIVTTIPTIGKSCYSFLYAFSLHTTLLTFQDSTWRRSSTRTSLSRCGMSEDKTRSDPCGDIVRLGNDVRLHPR